MAVTPNYGWPIPVATDYVKDGWDAIADLGNAIDTTVAGLGSGLVLTKTQTIGTAVSSVTVTSCFNATYDNYKIIISGSTHTVDGNYVYLQLNNSTGSTYYWGGYSENYTGGAVSALAGNAQTSMGVAVTQVDGTSFACEVLNPNLAKYTAFNSYWNSNSAGGVFSGVNKSTNLSTGFIISFGAGTITGGTIRVYGYQNS